MEQITGMKIGMSFGFNFNFNFNFNFLPVNDQDDSVFSDSRLAITILYKDCGILTYFLFYRL